MSAVLVALYGMTIIYALIPIKINQKRNEKYFWAWCTFVLCILVTTTDNYADLYNYTNYYNDVNYKGWDIHYRAMPTLWGWLCKLFGGLGFEYRGMIIAIIIFSMWLTHSFVKSLDCSEKIFWGFYLIFPGLIQVVQLRFFLGSSIVVFVLKYLLRENIEKRDRIRNIIKFIAGVIFASMIHNACIFLAVLLVIVFFKRLNIPKALGITILGVVVLFVLLPLVPRVLSLFINAFYVQRYFTASTTRITMSRLIKIVMVWILNVGLSILIMYSNSDIKREGLRNISQSRWLFSRCFTGICILSVSLPLLYYDENFHRFFEIGFMMLFVMYGKLYHTRRNTQRQNCILLLFLIMVSLMFCVYVYYPFESIVIPLFGFDGFAQIIH